jgi:hypothetical protein
MADLLPINFPVPSESAIASYDYTDIAEGTGVVKFMGMVDMDDNGMLVTSESIGSHKAYRIIASGGSATLLNKSFDVTFNMPKTIKGKCICCIPVSGSAGNARDRSAAVTIYHVNAASTATSLGTDTGTDIGTASATIAANEVINVVINVAKKHFKKGETLRINVNATRSDTGGDDTIGHDPMNRTTDSSLTTSQMSFFIPFVLDL